MACNAARERLFAYIDGELPNEQRETLDAHLRGCPECQHLVELERAFREIYVAPLRPDPAPAALRDRLTRQLAEAAGPARDRSPRSWTRRALAAVSIAAVVVGGAAWGLTGLWMEREASASLRELADASVEQHRKLSQGLLPLDIARVSPKDAERWFSAKLSFNVTLPELKSEHLNFLGGRISHLREINVAALEYQVDGKNVSLFVIPAEEYQRLGLSPKPKFKLVNRSGYDVITWSSHGVAYALVSEIGGRSCTVCHSPDERLDVTLQPEVHRAR
jgi:mycothiol system anti-sigma-R factor